MSQHEYERWQFWNQRVDGPHVVDSPCYDCPVGFAIEMRAAGRCDGEPRDQEDDVFYDAEERRVQNALNAAAINRARKDARIREALELHEMGMSKPQIAKEMGLRRETIYKYFQQAARVA
jgi:DNA-binding phage protein